MATTQAQRDAQKKYDAANTKQYHLKLNTTTDEAIIGHLDAKKNTQGYIKSLIRDDMEQKKTIRLLLTVTYVNGRTLRQFVNYLHMESGHIYFTTDTQVHGVFQEPIKISIRNIKSYDLQQVAVVGWEMPSE